MKIIGITGPTGAGKTTALYALESLGGRVLDCDAVYHDLLEHHAGMRSALADRFGDGILDESGMVDRKKLGAIVFTQPDALEDLNAITHPYIRAAIREAAEQGRAEGCPALAVDAIALVESGISADCDAVVAVLAPKELRIRRIMAREGISEDYARKRVEAQQGDDFFRAHCAYVLENHEEQDRDSFAAQARNLFETILNSEKKEI